jgi:hypothetical protein
MMPLSSMATTFAWFWIAVGAAVAMLTAIGTALYSFAAWINQFGAGGWVVTVAVAIFVSALIVGTVAWS